MLGQMMEPVEFRDDLPRMELPAKDWAATGTMGERAPRVINSLYLKPEELEALLRDQVPERAARLLAEMEPDESHIPSATDKLDQYA